jgi:hypothetical protein
MIASLFVVSIAYNMAVILQSRKAKLIHEVVSANGERLEHDLVRIRSLFLCWSFVCCNLVYPCTVFLFPFSIPIYLASLQASDSPWAEL